MKKILIFGALLGTLLTACSDDFLDQFPKGKWHSENMPEDELDKSILVEGKLLQAYGDLRDWNNFWSVFAMHNYTTPEGEKGSSPADGGADVLAFESMTYNPSNGIIGGYYGICYATIYKTNEALLLQSQMKEDHPKKNLYKAEALFLRAWMYYRLTQAFGDVPYIDRILSQDEQSPTRMNIDQVRSNYLDDLKAALPLLPTREELKKSGNSGRATQNAARAIIAKTYMLQKNWEGVKTHTQQIIESGDNNLSTLFAEMFYETNEYGPESILEVFCEQKPSLKIYQGSQFGSTQGFRGQPDLGWGFNAPGKALIDAFEAGDPRKSATIIAPGDDLEGRVATANGGDYGYCNKKAYAPMSEFALYGRSSGDQGNWKNIRIIRYADILLMYAEACCELGGEDNIKNALSKLELVRSRARGNNASVLPKVTTLDQEQLRQAIRHERKVELGLEFERFYDLVRWGIAKDVISGFVVGRHELFPIPQSEIDKSKNIITQNPGYN